MESEEASLEDGEIDDYTPLERPTLLQEKAPVNGVPPAITSREHERFSSAAVKWDDDDDDQTPSSSESDDSDSDNGASAFRPKKSKPSKQRIKFTAERPVKKKYNVWCDGLQEETLSETLMVNCDVDKVDRSRNVESYDYQMKYRLGDQDGVKHYGDNDGGESDKDDHPKNNKRRHWECGSKGKKKWNRRRSSEREEGNDWRGSVCRTLLDLQVTDADQPEDVAKDICDKLSEKNDNLIQRVVNVLGIGKAISLYNETKQVEEDGGMMVMNGSRRRTSGGVYLTLVKKDADTTQEMIKSIFVEDKVMTQQFRKRAKEQNQKLRNSRTNEIKKSIIEDRLLPNLLTRPELELAARARTSGSGGTETGGDPPPSPASNFDFDAGGETAANTPQLLVANYGDDFLQLNVDDNMEVF